MKLKIFDIQVVLMIAFLFKTISLFRRLFFPSVFMYPLLFSRYPNSLFFLSFMLINILYPILLIVFIYKYRFIKNQIIQKAKKNFSDYDFYQYFFEMYNSITFLKRRSTYNKVFLSAKERLVPEKFKNLEEKIEMFKNKKLYRKVAKLVTLIFIISSTLYCFQMISDYKHGFMQAPVLSYLFGIIIVFLIFIYFELDVSVLIKFNKKLINKL